MGLASATESYAASALYTTLASLSGALWRIRWARAYLPAMSPRLSDKPQRRAKHRVSRLSTREIHRHVAYQLNSFSDHLVAARTAVLAEKRVASTAIPADVYSLNRCPNG